MMLTMTTAPATVSPPRRRPPSSLNPAALRRLGLPLGFPLPPLTVPRPLSPPMSPTQTKEVEYYRAAPSAPGSHSIDLQRVHPVSRPALARSPSDPPAVAPLAINKRVKAPPAAIVVPPNLNALRPPRSPARQTSYFDADAPSNASATHLAPKPNRGPAPGPPPMGPLPPLPDQQAPFTGVDPLVLRAVAAKERREARRQSKTPDDKELASLDRSMRRLSRISLANSPAGETSGPTSPTTSVAGSLNSRESQMGRERAEKLLRRISRQSEGIRLPSDYGRVGISGFSVPSSAPVSPGIRGVTPLRLHKSETETSELAYLIDERPVPALSVPMRRNVEQAYSAPGAYTPAEPNNGLGLGLILVPSDSTPSITSMSTLPSDQTLATLSSESTIRATLETRPSRLGSLSSASSTAASTHSSQTFETASTSSLLTPISPPTITAPLPKLPRSPSFPPRPLKMKATIRLPSPGPSAVPLPARSGSPDIPSILAQFRDTQSLAVAAPEVQAVPATRVRPGARPRLHSDLAPLDIPPPVPSKDVVVGSEGMESNRSSTDSRVAVEDSRVHVEEAVLDVPVKRPSLESQTTPRMTHAQANRSAAPTPTPKSAATSTRPVSPDISYILRTTPRPTRHSSTYSLASSAATSRRPSVMNIGSSAPPSSFRAIPGMAGPSRRGSDMSMSVGSSSRRTSSAVTACSQGLDVEGAGPEVFFGEQYDSDDSDSDLDLSTPLPHMMLRAGLLSPRSTIITELMELPSPGPSGLSARGEALRLKGEKVWKAESKRKIRHRDGRNLRDGVGLTTGLGWSDSEDEDAPSPLRRRLSSVLMAKAQAQSRPSSQLARHSALTISSRRSTSSNLDSTSVSSQSLPRTPASHPLSLPLTPSSLPGAVHTVDEFGKLDFPLPPTATSWRPQPSPALRRFPSNTMMRSTSVPTPAVPSTPSSTLRARTPSSSGASSTSARTPARSKMPTPTPRPSRINVRAPATTRLSAPEALREANGLVSDGSRRLSGA